MEVTRIVIIEEQPLFRAGIRKVLEQNGHFIIGEAITSVALESICMTASPDIAIVGELTSNDALALTRLVRCCVPNIGIIFLTNNEDEEYFFQAIKVGAASYALRSIEEATLLEIVHKVSQGEYLISDAVISRPHVASRVLQSFHEPPKKEAGRTPLHTPLSAREIEILEFIARGNSNKEIAKSLKISDQTVKNHITSILKKLSVNDRTAAVVQALQHGWIGLEK